MWYQVRAADNLAKGLFEQEKVEELLKPKMFVLQGTKKMSLLVLDFLGESSSVLTWLRTNIRAFSLHPVSHQQSMIVLEVGYLLINWSVSRGKNRFPLWFMAVKSLSGLDCLKQFEDDGDFTLELHD